jgi:hypothetical protein
VKIVRKSPPGFARKRAGIKDHVTIKESPAPNSTRKNRMLKTIRAYVTTGNVLRALLSSPIGNI